MTSWILKGELLELIMPAEIYKEILSWVALPIVHNKGNPPLPGRGSSRLQTPLCIYPDFHVVLNTSHVCATFREVVIELVSSRVALRSPGELQFFKSIFTRHKGVEPAYSPGSKTKSIEVKMVGEYDRRSLSTLLSFTPNLDTFVLDGCVGPLGNIPSPLVDALTMYVPRLERLYFDSRTEAPAFNDVISLMKNLKHLQVLHVGIIHSYPNLTSFMESRESHEWESSVVKISLGVVRPRCNAPSSYSWPWDKFLMMLTHPQIKFPLLRELCIPMLPSSPLFFSLYGHQIRHIHTASFSNISQAIEMCPHLNILTIEQCDQVPRFPVKHEGLECINILPCMGTGCHDRTRAPSGSRARRKLASLLDGVYTVQNPTLSKVVIHMVGVFRVLQEHPAFLAGWRDKWRDRAVTFVVENGVSEGYTPGRQACPYEF